MVSTRKSSAAHRVSGRASVSQGADVVGVMFEPPPFFLPERQEGQPPGTGGDVEAVEHPPPIQCLSSSSVSTEAVSEQPPPQSSFQPGSRSDWQGAPTVQACLSSLVLLYPLILSLHSNEKKVNFISLEENSAVCVKESGTSPQTWCTAVGAPGAGEHFTAYNADGMTCVCASLESTLHMCYAFEM